MLLKSFSAPQVACTSLAGLSGLIGLAHVFDTSGSLEGFGVSKPHNQITLHCTHVGIFEGPLHACRDSKVHCTHVVGKPLHACRQSRRLSWHIRALVIVVTATVSPLLREGFSSAARGLYFAKLLDGTGFFGVDDREVCSAEEFSWTPERYGQVSFLCPVAFRGPSHPSSSLLCAPLPSCNIPLPRINIFDSSPALFQFRGCLGGSGALAAQCVAASLDHNAKDAEDPEASALSVPTISGLYIFDGPKLGPKGP